MNKIIHVHRCSLIISFTLHHFFYPFSDIQLANRNRSRFTQIMNSTGSELERYLLMATSSWVILASAIMIPGFSTVTFLIMYYEGRFRLQPAFYPSWESESHLCPVKSRNTLCVQKVKSFALIEMGQLTRLFVHTHVLSQSVSEIRFSNFVTKEGCNFLYLL